SYTGDGGATWTTTPIPGLTQRAGAATDVGQLYVAGSTAWVASVTAAGVATVTRVDAGGRSSPGTIPGTPVGAHAPGGAAGPPARRGGDQPPRPAAAPPPPGGRGGAVASRRACARRRADPPARRHVRHRLGRLCLAERRRRHDLAGRRRARPRRSRRA